MFPRPGRHLSRYGGNAARTATLFALPVFVAGLAACSTAPPKAAVPAVRASAPARFRVAPKDGEFRRSFTPGDGISCTVGGAARKANSPAASHCLRLGPLRIGDSYAALVSKLGRLGIPPEGAGGAHTVRERVDGTRIVVFPIERSDGTRRPRLRSYVVATVDASSTIRRLQVTGVPSRETSALVFSGIALGSGRGLVADVLGHPSSAEDVAEIDARMWSYAPYPFGIELVDDRVYAIVVGEPSEDDAFDAFLPLDSVDD